MRRYGLLIVLIVMVGRLFGEGIPSSSTAFKGNVTLFDYNSPWAGINNPALLVGFGGYPNPWVFRTASTNRPEWGLGRVYLVSATGAVGVNTSFYQLLEAYLYWLAYQGNASQCASTREILDRIRPLTGDAFSTEMLAHPTNDFQYIQRAMNLILSNSTPGFYLRMSGSLFSISLPLSTFLASTPLASSSIAFQPIVDLEAYGSLTSRKSTFFFVKDPEVATWLRIGMVGSLGLGRYTLPWVGDVALGVSVGWYPVVARVRFDSFEELNTYMTTVSTNQNAFLGYTNVFQGMGVGLDVAALKSIGESWQVALKVENLPFVMWATNQKPGIDWVPPNVIAGVRYTYPIEKPVKFFVNEPSVYMEVEDLLYTKPLALLSKVRLGADVKLLLDMLQVGVGINQGYPTAGARVNLTLSWIRDMPGMPGIVNVLLFPFTMGNLAAHVSYYGKELGYYPGQKEALGYVVGLEYYLEFGANGPSRRQPKASSPDEKQPAEGSLTEPVFQGELPKEVSPEIKR